MEQTLRNTLKVVMKEIQNEEDRNGKLVIIANVEKNVAFDAPAFNGALDYLEEHCAIYRPREGFIVRF